MPGRIALAAATLVVGICSPAAAQHEHAPQRVEDFTFLDVTDTHQTASGSNTALRSLADAAQAMSPKPAFIIDTGDITESGRPEEYARFKEATSGLSGAGIAFYAVPGNHDVRWCPDGKEGFVHEFGKLYRSFDYGGVHFVLLDSTVLLEHWGHFDKAELDWLRKDMKAVKPETPVMLFMHHWIGRDGPATRMIDNEFDLVPILRDHNVMAIFTGHGHQDLVWQTNGVTTLMARGLYQGSYYRVSVTPLMVQIDRIVKETPGKPIHIASLPIAQPKPSALRVEWDDPDVPYLWRRRPAATLEPRAVTDNPDKENCQYRVDGGDWKAMAKDARDIWRAEFQTKPVPVGVHSADIQLTTSAGAQLDDELIFEVERDQAEPTRTWAENLDGPIQSSPVLAGSTLFVTSVDGRLTAFDASNGKRRWSVATHGASVSTPLVQDATVYFGSGDHFLYAIEAASGHERWKFDTGDAVFATPAVAHGIVCIGANQHIYGINAATGAQAWVQPAGSFFQSRAATDGSAFFLGGWDNTLYALDAQSGTPRWTAHMGRAFYYSPAIASPAVDGGMVYVCSDDDTLHAVDARTGQEKWHISAPQGADLFGYSSPAIANGRLYAAGVGDHGDVYAIDASNGQILWRARTGQTIYDSSPSLSPDHRSLAIMAVRGSVSVLSTENGDRLWGYSLGPGNIFSTPAYDGSTVYTTTMADDVQAIKGPASAAAPVGPASAPVPRAAVRGGSGGR